MSKKKALIIFGPTSSGKSSLAMQIAKSYDSIIINADSLQVYKELRIITSRPSIEDENNFTHKLYGFLDGSQNCTLSMWLDFTKIEINKALAEDKLPIVVGGTGMYLNGLINGISSIPNIPLSIQDETKIEIKKNGLHSIFEILHNKNKNLKINTNDTQRIQRAYNVLKTTGKTIEECNLNNKEIIHDLEFDILIQTFNREKIYRDSEKRFDKMIDNGAVDEVRELIKKDYNNDLSIMKAIGVREIAGYLQNDLSIDKAIELAKQKTRNYIKRQITWINGNNITQNTILKKYV